MSMVMQRGGCGFGVQVSYVESGGILEFVLGFGRRFARVFGSAHVSALLLRDSG